MPDEPVVTESSDAVSALIQQAQAGTPDSTLAFEELYLQYRAAVEKFIRRQVGNRPQLVEDLTQETFLHALRALPRFMLQRAGFGAWLYRIARNLVIDHSRRPTNQEILTPEPWGEFEDGENFLLGKRYRTADSDIGNIVATQQSYQALYHFLSELKQTQRDVIILRFFYNMSLKEVADRLQITVVAVKQLQVRGLANLRRQIPDGLLDTLRS